MRTFPFYLIALLLLGSCTVEAVDHSLIGRSEFIEFTASFEDSTTTKTAVQSDGKSVWWNPHESINIFYGNSESSKFTSTNDEPVAKAHFRGMIEGFTGETDSGEPNSFWAIYPYNASNTCDGSSVTATLPANQVAAAETFADGQWPTLAKSQGLALSFYSIGSGFRFSVTHEGVTSVTFQGNNNEILAGKARITMDGSNRPVAQEYIEPITRITLSAPNGQTLTVGTLYYLSFFPNNFENGFTVTFRTATATGTRVYDTPINFKRSDVHRGKNFDANVVYDDSFVPVTSISLNQTEAKIEQYQTLQLTAIINPINATDPTVTWTSSDSSIAFVDNKGKITAKKAGSAIITVKAGDQSSACLLTITSVDPNSRIPFADPNVKAKLVAAFDTNEDGEVSYAEAAAAKSIDGVFGAIKTYTSFDEFQWFTGITVIPNSMFEGWRLSSIALPESIVTIGNNAFSGCISLSSIVLPATATYLGSGAFKDCSSLSFIKVPQGVNTIESYTFYGCKNLNTIEMPESVQIFSNYSFSGCEQLSGIAIPINLSSIPDYVFMGCANITSITIPDGVTNIGVSAFQGCTGLTNIHIPKTVSSIGHHAFCSCTGLSSIEIPDNVSTIGIGAFMRCSNAKTVSIPESINIIPGSAFYECLSLDNVFIPESVTYINNSAFYGCTSLANISIPESVSSLGTGVFESCSSLVSITLPQSITAISSSLFKDCINLSSVNMPEEITSIQSHAFYGCTNLASFTIPKNVSNMGYACFYHCYKLCLYMRPTTPPILGNMAFETNSISIYVPANSLEDYTSADGWKHYKKSIQSIPES